MERRRCVNGINTVAAHRLCAPAFRPKLQSLAAMSVDVRKRIRAIASPFEQDRVADLRTRQDGEQHEHASTGGTFGTTIRWRTP